VPPEIHLRALFKANCVERSLQVCLFALLTCAHGIILSSSSSSPRETHSCQIKGDKWPRVFGRH